MKNFSVINPEVDAVLASGPDWLYDMFAVMAIVLGVMFSFFGLKTVRLQSTFYGAFICGAFGSFILYLIPEQESGGVWLGVVIPMAVIGGYLIGRVVILRKVTLFIALGAAVAGVFNQYALSYFVEVPSWLIWTIMAVALVISAVFIWRYFHISAILATSFLGGFIVLLGTARLTRGPISLIGMWVDPEFLQECITLTCWIPFMVGASVFLLGSLFQICMRRREKMKKKISDAPEDDDWTARPSPTRPTVRPINTNPFDPHDDSDPLIVELSQTLDSRNRRRQQDDIGLA